MMKQRAYAALLVIGSLSVPLAAGAQTAMTGTQQTGYLRYALAHFDAETKTLATMRNHISSRDIVTIGVAGLDIGAPERRTLTRSATGSRHAALLAALGKATVADVDRANGQSEDQSSFAEYLQRTGINPNNVVAVDVDPRQDPQNPRVLVFYRK